MPAGLPIGTGYEAQQPRRARVGVCLGFGVLLIALNVLTLVSAAGTYSPYELTL